MIYHAALPADWEKARRAGAYTVSTRGRSLADEGFIHAAHESQLAGVLERFYADVDEIVVLAVDSDRLAVPVREETPDGAEEGERFPHVYGPIAVAAVVEARSWQRHDDGWHVDVQSRPDR